tara:strand:+ start:1425 stop:1586 length:162 start_codon:yes stop_codon:yes gene_type:complete
MTSHKKVTQQLDKKDILASFRDRFFHPEKVIYLDGNSLGKQVHVDLIRRSVGP